MPSLLSMLQEFAHFAWIVIQGVFSGSAFFASKIKAQERYKTCQSCAFFVARSKRCAKCGCFLRVKTKIELAECPIKAWDK
jgi:uncharacterized paraquat-inducible protein A